MTKSPHDSKVPLLVEQDGPVTTLTINDAPWNRMSLEFMDELEVVVDKLSLDKSVRNAEPCCVQWEPKTVKKE